ncbi:MAG: hypothetical protein L0Y68_04060 [Candidatus Dadabacteria bacterium]|nr:hypothetical protein [Candidatus Dadabacteria bacterium]
MKITDIVRTIVLKTNRWWPFSQLNKTPYYIAIWAFVRLCKRFTQIKSVYLRHRLVEGNWTPALSDIDLTVIIDSKLTAEEEFSFLYSFWKNYEGMKKLFPMLGEIEVLNDEHIGSWIKFGIEGYTSQNWILVYGIETVKSNFLVNPKRLAIESLNYALFFYLRYSLEKFRQEGPPYLVSQDLKRLVHKILRCLNYTNTDDNKKQTVVGRLDDKTDMLFHVLKGLEEGIRFTAPSDNEVGSRKSNKEWLCDVDSHNKVFFENQALDIRALTSQDEAIQSIILNYHKKIFIVLKDGLDALATKSCINTIRRVFAQEDKMPIIIVSFCIFKYILRCYNPFEYTHFIRYRIVAYGKDLLSDIQPPDKTSFINYLIRQTPTLLTFPRNHKLFSPPTPDWFLRRELESMVERSLFLKLYLEKGVIKPWHYELLTESQRHYPEDYKKMRELQESTSQFRNETLSREWFRLLRSMANDIHNYVTNSNIAENLFQIDQS